MFRNPVVNNFPRKSKQETHPSHAYVTFLAGDGDYVKGVVGLAKGLRKVKAAYPIVVAVLHDVPEEHRRMLAEQGCLVREIETVYPSEKETDSQFAWAYYAVNYSKLSLWNVSFYAFFLLFVFWFFNHVYLHVW